MRKVAYKKETVSKTKKQPFRGFNFKSRRRKSFPAIEDSQNLSSLDELAKSGTSKAYERALLVADEIITIRDGRLIREIKGKYCEQITNFEYRKVEKGLTFDIPL